MSANRPSLEKELYPARAYAWYVVAVLTIAYMFAFIDRQILNLLVGPIRRDLGISDTKMSLLMGFSFAFFYSVFGIPLGRLADSRSRRTIIAAGMVLWSLLTAGCGLAKSFGQFLLLRMGVGVGEAALSPSAYSLISDYFPKESRATAISVYSMAFYLGSGIAFLLGGLVVGFASAKAGWNLPLVGTVRPWQLIFFVVGLPGAMLALLLYTVREPTRKGARMMNAADGRGKVAQLPLGDVLAYMRQNWLTFFCHHVGFAFLAFSSFGSSAWIPTFFIRRYGWTGPQAGVVYGTIVCIFGTLGIVTGGRMADWLAERGCQDSNMRVGLMAALGWGATGILFPLMPNAFLATTLLIPTVFLMSQPVGVAAAAIQEMVPNNMRGQASALYLFVINLIGLGLGPTAVAMMTDFVFHNDRAINYSLVVVGTLAHLVAAALLGIGLRPFRHSLDRLKDRTLGASVPHGEA
ncbi:MAG TPA: MFS transporter [Candidatus Acidoferrales bacterium]|nr:MFS transporter [Candidatus Acidoferrales bacterium]